MMNDNVEELLSTDSPLNGPYLQDLCKLLKKSYSAVEGTEKEICQSPEVADSSKSEAINQLAEKILDSRNRDTFLARLIQYKRQIVPRQTRRPATPIPKAKSVPSKPPPFDITTVSQDTINKSLEQMFRDYASSTADSVSSTASPVSFCTGAEVFTSSSVSLPLDVRITAPPSSYENVQVEMGLEEHFHNESLDSLATLDSVFDLNE